MAIRQVQAHPHFPSGDSRALVEIPFDPAELAARFGLAFEDAYDDLDRYQRAAIALPDGSQAWLVKYRGEADAGTTVYVDAAADVDAAKNLLLRTMLLTEEDLLWVAPEVAASQTGPSSAPTMG